MLFDTVFVVESKFVDIMEKLAFIFSVDGTVECITEKLVCDNVCSLNSVDDACKEVPESNEIIFDTVIFVDSIFVIIVVVHVVIGVAVIDVVIGIITVVTVVIIVVVYDVIGVAVIVVVFVVVIVLLYFCMLLLLLLLRWWL